MMVTSKMRGVRDQLELLPFCDENYVILVPALWVLGYALKQTPKVPNWSIIWILTIVSLIFATISYGLTIDAIVNGLIASGTAVYGHQLLKQTKNIRSGK
jgi:hypothetical protein